MGTAAREILERVHALAGQIKTAVECRDGERMIELVAEYQAIAELMLQTPLRATDNAEQSLQKQLAEDVIALQREITQLAGPWLDDLRILLRENKKEQNLNATYRTEP